MVSRKPPLALAVAGGIATIGCLPLFSPLVSPRHLAVYHEQGPAWQLFLPIMIVAVTLWLAVTLLLLIVRPHRRLHLIFWVVMASFLPAIALRTILLELGIALSHPAKIVFLLASLAGVLLLLLLARRTSAARLDRLLRIAELAAALTAWSGIVLAGQSLWFLYAARPTPEPLLLARSAATPPGPLVLWILFDELSQDQVFDHRFPGLSLPAFDRFAAQSTTFTHAVPTNLYTEAALPALMTGLPVRRIEASANGRELTLDLPSGDRKRFDPHQTVFDDVLQLGYPTAVAGWYNPYCRILAPVLNACTWVAHRDTLPGGFRTDTPVRRNLVSALLAPFAFASRLLHHRDSSFARAFRADHLDEYRRVETDALAVLDGPPLGFALLHVAAPHPEGIYSRHARDHNAARRRRLQLSYIDNLALADHFLSEVEESLNRKGQWNQATIVIMGDHSWRTRQIWRISPVWTPEDEIASHHGAFDPRPAYLVKLPGQQTAARIDGSFDTVRTRLLFDQLLVRRIQTPEQLATWAAHP